MRGGEKVLLELCRLFPDARIHTLICDAGSVAPEIEARVAETSYLQGLRRLTNYRNLLPLFPSAITSLNIEAVDLVISSSHAVASGVRPPAGVPHLCYLHTPMRYLWGESDHYFAYGTGRNFKRAALAAIRPYLRRFDRQSAARVDQFVANSETVRDRALAVYGRKAEVVYPPVDVGFYRPGPLAAPDGYYLSVSALEPYKRIDLLLESFRELKRKLIVVGEGTLLHQLRRDAPPNVELTGRLEDEELRDLYQRCRAFILPGLEDFGIAAVEAQACGRPVICYGKGGGVETVRHGVTGLHFAAQSQAALTSAVMEFERMEWSREAIRTHAERFSTERFHSRMLSLARAAGGCA